VALPFAEGAASAALNGKPNRGPRRQAAAHSGQTSTGRVVATRAHQGSGARSVRIRSVDQRDRVLPSSTVYAAPNRRRAFADPTAERIRAPPRGTSKVTPDEAGRSLRQPDLPAGGVVGATWRPSAPPRT